MSAPATSIASSSAPALPLVVQVGFAGSRFLFDAEAHQQLDEIAFHDAVVTLLTERLGRLHEDLGLGDRYFFCGISPLAIGADMAFTRACARLHRREDGPAWLQRLFLPQARESFLDATNSRGTPDFPPALRQAAADLFDSEHVIQEHVASDSPDRHTRFAEVNAELLAVSNLVVCLVGVTADEGPGRAEGAARGAAGGGTQNLIDEAQRQSHPLLEIRVRADAKGSPQFDERWHHKDRFIAPSLPRELCGLQRSLTGIPSAGQYCDALKNAASNVARSKQRLFKRAALLIITVHVIATMLAVTALKLDGAVTLAWLLGSELVLLVLGLSAHEYLHFVHPVRTWAMARLVAETARSVSAMLRTVSVLHLRDTRHLSAKTWPERRDKYVATRLTNKPSGQIPYYEGQRRRAKAGRAAARYVFLFGSGCAIVATGLKLLLTCECPLPTPEHWHDGLKTWAGFLAVVLPVVAVAALSLAASYDLEARVDSYKAMLDGLRDQSAQLQAAGSEQAFRRLALATETHLLGENASWYARRSFTGVT